MSNQLPLRIIYMGTPDFAVPPLEKLIEEGYTIAAVITAPDKPAGRGRKLTPSPVKVFAEEKGLKVLQPTNLKSPDFIQILTALDANLQIVVAFRMLPKVVWSMPELGTFNLHASLLPDYRGAAPINWAIINGEKETGLTTFFLQHQIDTGDILLQEKEPIHEDDTAGTLYARLMQKGAALVSRTVKGIANQSLHPVPQPTTAPPKEAPKIFRDTCKIDWLQPSKKIYNFIRGLSPYPAAWTDVILQKNCKILAARIAGEKQLNPGEIETDNKQYLYIGTADQAIAVEELQLQGKKKMTTEVFLRGTQL